MVTRVMSELPRSEMVGTEAFNRNQLSRWQILNSDLPTNVEHGADWQRRVLHVLVVDDYQDTAETFAMLVKCWGYDAHAVRDAAAVLAWAAAMAPDVVLLDIQMAVMDGCQVARRLRLGLTSQDCLIVAITGRADHARRQECMEAGIDLVLLKPVDLSVVETLLLLESNRVNCLWADTEYSPRECLIQHREK